MTEYYTYITKDNDRWDLISNRFYHSPHLYEEIIKANPDVPKEPILKAGIKLKIPVIEESETINLIYLPGRNNPFFIAHLQLNNYYSMLFLIAKRAYLLYNSTMISPKEIEKYKVTISAERLSAFIYSDSDNICDVLNRYQDNIKISQALYPELSVLEVTLRNAIDTAFKTQFGEDWLEQEVMHNNILDSYDYETLLKAYNDIKKECSNGYKIFTSGKVIANLSFGFWTNICLKKYNAKVWTKKGVFKGVFVNYPKEKQQQIHAISNTLNSIRKLRNRVFHYERVLKNTVSILKKYNEILEILNYLPQNDSNILLNTSNFLNVYNEITATNKAKT